MERCCSICQDDEELVVFSCSKVGCDYNLCASCIRDAFKDESGSNSAVCMFCNNPSAMDMVSAVCGPGAINAVKEKVRSKIEFELSSEMLKRETNRKEISEMNVRARDIFNEITEQINLRCPRCQIVFSDYDGCNALQCASHSCKAAFCAICLKDCGTDAHGHVRTQHGDLFDKSAFQKSKDLRSKTIVENRLAALSHESNDLMLLVRNHIDKATLLCDGMDSHQTRTTRFLKETRKNLKHAITNDRLGLLSNPEEYRPGHGDITERDISPRSVISSDFRVTMTSTGREGTYRLNLEHESRYGEWESISLDKVAKLLKDTPHIDNVVNLIKNTRCAVIAFAGQDALFQSNPKKSEHPLEEDEVCVHLSKINQNGELEDKTQAWNNLFRIIGLNPNVRMLQLEKHVNKATNSDLMFTSLKHFVGDGKAVPCLTEILRPVPNTLKALNKEQQRVAHPLYMKSAMEVAGPPGTGKTKTIIELVNAVLECTDYDVIVLSERNGAINAVAEKFRDSSLDIVSSKSTNIKNLRIWTSLLTFGAGDTIGKSTKLFTLEEKLSYHPELVELKKRYDMLVEMSKGLAKCMRDELATAIEKFGEAVRIQRAIDRAKTIRDDTVKLISPLTIIRYIEGTIEDITSLLQGPNRLTEGDVEKLVESSDAILNGLFEIRTIIEKDKRPKLWDRANASRNMIEIRSHLSSLLTLDIFDEEKAHDLYDGRNNAQTYYKAAIDRIRGNLEKDARVHMSTIGSSHKLPVHEEDTDLSKEFEALSMNDFDTDQINKKKTIIVFDEAGCIPSYELLGLSRLGRDIQALILVGDKHQLPPYDASQGKRPRSQRYGSSQRFGRKSREMISVKSLLDVSTLSINDSKVVLGTQYRVPKDIADMLNTRVYKGYYKTCPTSNIPHKGLRVEHVQRDPRPRKKYVNAYEVRRGLELVEELDCDDRIASILVITPYKNQQREFQYQMKHRDLSCTVLTIDQCQGQEADAVILSLVQKPTMFLNLNRLNVALSRVRKKLYVLADKDDLEEACRDSRLGKSASLLGDLIQFEDH